MKRKRVTRKRSSKVRRQCDPMPWKYCFLTVICGLLLLSGFFVAAINHFSAVNTAMGNHDMRVRILKLKDEKRRLLLSKERASSPRRIASLAKTIGFTTAPRIAFSASANFERASSNSSDQKPVFSYAAARVDDSTIQLNAKQNKTDLNESNDPSTLESLQSQVAAVTASEFIKNVKK